MSTDQHGGPARQWPGPPPAAERKAAEVEDDFARDDAKTAPDADTSDVPATLLEPDHTEEFRRRWDAIKASFVDDPQEAVRRAERLAEEVVTEVARTVDARRRDLIERREGIGDQDDKSRTERLRVVLHGYRGVLDPVLRR
ncbi:MAG TPA: hypothetical protein VFU43_26020 [Streptosporangiaceae bacterium]|nr:hypothetical protein [Streptosporangiaceae bacterium]